MAGGFALALPKGGRQVADAFTFARYAGGPQGMRTYSVLHGNIPVLKAVAADPVFRTDPHHAQFMDQLPHAWNRPVTIEAQLLWDGMGTAQADVMNLKADPKSALSDLTQRVNAQLQLDAQQH
jgi:ABC-type glycerol-3-phosphate transport system substrate-binding protein